MSTFKRKRKIRIVFGNFLNKMRLIINKIKSHALGEEVATDIMSGKVETKLFSVCLIIPTVK
jgi:hypothetical protein